MLELNGELHYAGNAGGNVGYKFIPPSVGGIGWLRPLLFKGVENTPSLLNTVDCKVPIQSDPVRCFIHFLSSSRSRS